MLLIIPFPLPLLLQLTSITVGLLNVQAAPRDDATRAAMAAEPIASRSRMEARIGGRTGRRAGPSLTTTSMTRMPRSSGGGWVARKSTSGSFPVTVAAVVTMILLLQRWC
jgi:hypothetical protein